MPYTQAYYLGAAKKDLKKKIFMSQREKKSLTIGFKGSEGFIYTERDPLLCSQPLLIKSFQNRILIFLAQLK